MNQERLVTRETKISDEELSNLLSAFGNHEAKAITLLVMKPHAPYTRWGIAKAVNEAQGETVQWRVKSNPFQYCKDCLQPIGLVAYPIYDDKLEIREFILTNKGVELGKPLAALLLDFSARWNVRLFDLFGGTSSSRSQTQEVVADGETIDFRKRSAWKRIHMYRELYTSPSPIVPVAELQRRLGVDSNESLSSHIQHLLSSGFIHEETFRDKSRKVYTAALNSSFESFNGLHGEVWQLLKQMREPIGFDVLLEFLQVDDERSAYVRTILAKLIATGHVVSENIPGFHLSTIKLNSEYREMIGELLQLMDSFQSMDPAILQLGRQYAREIARDADRIGHFMAQGKERSPRAKNNLSQSEIKRSILHLLAQSEEPLSSADIQERLADFHRLAHHSVMGYLSEMVQDQASQVAITHLGRGRKYYLKKMIQ